MITQEVDVQRLVHSLEQGKGAGLFRLILSIAAVIVLALAYLVLQFRGLSTSTGIDQAQIAREPFQLNFVREVADTKRENIGAREDRIDRGRVAEEHHGRPADRRALTVGQGHDLDTQS